MTILTYGPGETVPYPGVYAVIHGKPHTQYKELFVDGSKFPSCRACMSQVTFRLIRAVDNISDDEDFRSDGPNATRKTA